MRILNGWYWFGSRVELITDALSVDHLWHGPYRTFKEATDASKAGA